MPFKEQSVADPSLQRPAGVGAGEGVGGPGTGGIGVGGRGVGIGGKGLGAGEGGVAPQLFEAALSGSQRENSSLIVTHWQLPWQHVGPLQGRIPPSVPPHCPQREAHVSDARRKMS